MKEKGEQCIPKNTMFCCGCVYYINNGETIMSREKGCEHAGYCEADCHSTLKEPCTFYDCSCNYLGVSDREGETSLIDGVKICNISVGF